MELSLKESLLKLERLSPAKLDQTSRRIRGELAGAEWKMGICLLAALRTKAFRALGYATISEYAEKSLHLSGQKTGRLLSVAKTLEHLPLLSEAFRTGKLGWAKIRAFNGLVTPETEERWLKFALAHKVEEIVNKVTLSPTAWKKYEALKASLEKKPIATVQEVDQILSSPEQRGSEQSTVPTCPRKDTLETQSNEEQAPENGAVSGSQDANSPRGESSRTGKAETAENTPCPASDREPMPMPAAPQKIRLVIELTPDQYALFERAESRARAQAQKRVSRAEVVTAMAKSMLEAGTARSRAKHQVLIHTDPQTGAVWYETEKGPLPVDPKVLEEAQKEREPLVITDGRIVEAKRTAEKPVAEPVADKSKEEQGSTSSLATTPSQHSPTRPLPEHSSKVELPVKITPAKHRSAIPNNTLRHLHAMAGQRCQRCGDRKGPFEAHHTKPISEGGTHQLSTLKLVCRACHSLVHEPDFATKPHWAAARAAKVGSRLD